MTDGLVWPDEGLQRIPDWVYTDETVYQREVERIFHGRTWNYVALEAEIANAGDFIRSNVGPTPVVVARGDGWRDPCGGEPLLASWRGVLPRADRQREGIRLSVSPMDVRAERCVARRAVSPRRRRQGRHAGGRSTWLQHGLRRLNVTTHRGVVFASYAEDMEPLAEYLGPEILREFEATFDGRPLRVLGHYRHTLPGNWKLYHENLKDPVPRHTAAHVPGDVRAAGRRQPVADAGRRIGRHGVMCSAKSDATRSRRSCGRRCAPTRKA